MLKELLKNPRALVYAVLIHVALIAILVVSIQWNAKPAKLQGSGDIVQATVIDEAKLQAEKERKRAAEEQRRRAELEKQRAEERRKREAEEAAQKKQQQEAERQRQSKLKAKKEAEERQRVAEQKRVAEQEAKRKIAEEKRQAEEAERKAEEARRKAEEQRKADEARRQRENEELLKQQMAQEEADRAAQQRQRELDSLQSQYVAVLQQRVTRNWLRPPTARAGMVCTVHVRLIPGGEVVEARVVRSSGDPAFDKSAETAVLKSSPLPPPPDPALFQREFDFVFKPEG